MTPVPRKASTASWQPLSMIERVAERRACVSNPAAAGSALAELECQHPDARVVNLKTSIARSETYIPKGINYRMSPENAGCLLAAGVDCCALANNQVLDWDEAGLLEPLRTLKQLRIKTAGAGRNCDEAWAPAIPGKGRVLVFSCASVTCGVAVSRAMRDAAGLALLSDLSARSVALIADEVARARRANDVVPIAPLGANLRVTILGARGIEVYRDRLNL